MLQWYYLAIISSVFISGATILEKKMLKKEYASAFAATSSLLIALATLVFIPFLKLDISMVDWLLIYIVALITTVSNVLVARTFRHGTLSATSPLNATLPTLFIIVLAYIFLKELLAPVQYIGIAITICAIIMLLFGRNSKYDFASTKYKYLIFVNAAITGVSSIIFKYLLGVTTPITFMILSQVFVAINMVVYMSLKYGGVREVLANTKVYSKEMGAIVVLTVGYMFFYYTAVVTGPISLASPLKNSILVVITMLSGAFIFKEPDVRRKILLSALILLGACLMIL